MGKRGPLYLLFFLSGVCGLIYEVVWFRLLRDEFGVTAHAVAAVLATYLGGLALGSWALGRFADRQVNPLRFYGLLEIGIGLTSWLGASTIPLSNPVHLFAASRFAPDSAILAGIRFLLASIVVLPATTLMGATLPAIAKAFIDRLERLGREVSFLYAVNTVGAVIGSLAAGFYLIRMVGVHATLGVAVALNLGVGAVALVFSRGATRSTGTESASGRSEKSDRSWVLLMVGLSGVASLVLEVIWTRVLVLIVGSSTYAFVTMLSAFLVGIAAGSLIARLFVDRLANPRRAFGWVQAGIAASTLATIPLLGALVFSAQKWLLQLDLHWLQLTFGRFGVSFVVLLVPGTLFGMTFPLAGKIQVNRLQELGSGLGRVYAANSLGNIGGAILGGFALLPAVGMQRGIVLATAFNIAGAAWGLFPSRHERARPRSLLRAAPIAATFLACLGLLAFWHPAPFLSIEEREGDRVLYYKEGLVSTVKVIQRYDDARQLVMLVDGIRIGQSTSGIDYKQQVLAHFPFLLKPEREIATILSIGLGTGILIGEVVKHPGVKRVDCVELEPSVIEGARLFGAFNGRVLDNPAVQIVADDGINYLKRSPASYDAIISDAKSRLGQAGNALFYSRDFYAGARAHLAPGGMMIQWMPLEEIPEDLRTIVRTFLAVFPRAYLWFGHDSLFLAGMEQPLDLDLARVQKVLDAPETAGLRRHGWRDATDLAALLVADGVSAKRWLAGESTINSLETPVLEFYSLRGLATRPTVRVAQNVAALATTRTSAFEGVRSMGGNDKALASHFRALGYLFEALALLGRGELDQVYNAANLLEAAVSEAPDASAIRYSVAATLVDMGINAERTHAVRLYRTAIQAWPENVTARLNLAIALLAEGGSLQGIEQLTELVQINPDFDSAHYLLAKAFLAINPEKAIQPFREALRIAPYRAEVHNDLARALAQVSRPSEALVEFREAMRLQPDWVAPMAEGALLLATMPDSRARNPGEAIRLAKRASELTSFQNPGVVEILAVSYAAAGRYKDAVVIQRKAVDLAKASGDANLAAEAENALDRYKRGAPVQ